MREWPTPKNKHEFRSCLGLCTYYRWFISDFANIAKPLTRLTEEKQAFQWTQEEDDAFQTLKGALCAAPILAYHQPGERFNIDTDASNLGFGGVHSQVQNGQELVKTYYSKTLNKAERNYWVTWVELLAIVRTMEHFHKILYGQEFHLCTDHSALTRLMNFKNLEGKLHDGYSAYTNSTLLPNIVKAGNKNADALSTRNCHEECTHCHKVDKQIRAISALPAAEWDPLVLRTEHLNDTDIGPILQDVEPGRRPQWKDNANRNTTYKSFWTQWKPLAVRNGVLDSKWESANRRSNVA
jgi:hypothetical protein